MFFLFYSQIPVYDSSLNLERERASASAPIWSPVGGTNVQLLKCLVWISMEALLPWDPCLLTWPLRQRNRSLPRPVTMKTRTPRDSDLVWIQSVNLCPWYILKLNNFFLKNSIKILYFHFIECGKNGNQWNSGKPEFTGFHDVFYESLPACFRALPTI